AIQPATTMTTVPSTESKPSMTLLPEPLQAAAKPSPHLLATNAVDTRNRSHLKAENTAVAVKKSEIKTDFIALTYARDSDSRQIVRVRVPSSMMVTLGIVATVKNSRDMVDAEVLVGDDGLTRAIRFIR